MSRGKPKRIFTESEWMVIKDTSLTSRAAGLITGISYSLINKTRIAIGFTRVKTPSIRVARAKKEKVVKPVKIPKKRVNVAKAESEKKEVIKAEKAKIAYHELQERQKLEGYRFATRVCERGVKSRVWTNKI